MELLNFMELFFSGWRGGWRVVGGAVGGSELNILKGNIL